MTTRGCWPRVAGGAPTRRARSGFPHRSLTDAGGVAHIPPHHALRDGHTRRGEDRGAGEGYDAALANRRTGPDRSRPDRRRGHGHHPAPRALAHRLHASCSRNPTASESGSLPASRWSWPISAGSGGTSARISTTSGWSTRTWRAMSCCSTGRPAAGPSLIPPTAGCRAILSRWRAWRGRPGSTSSWARDTTWPPRTRRTWTTRAWTTWRGRS